MAGPRDTLGSPWIPLEIRPCLDEVVRFEGGTGAEQQRRTVQGVIKQFQIHGDEWTTETGVRDVTSVTFCVVV
jgi:hypothetical protein